MLQSQGEIRSSAHGLLHAIADRRELLQRDDLRLVLQAGEGGVGGGRRFAGAGEKADQHLPAAGKFLELHDVPGAAQPREQPDAAQEEEGRTHQEPIWRISMVRTEERGRRSVSRREMSILPLPSAAECASNSPCACTSAGAIAPASRAAAAASRRGATATPP